MKEREEALKLIAQLQKGHVKASCNNCDETFDLAKAGLFYGEEMSASAKDIADNRIAEAKAKIVELKDGASKKMVRIEAAARSVNIGFAVERIAPVLQGFGFDRNDCRSMFDPVDYVIFDGLTRNHRIEKIVFSDIKSGKARLNFRQQQIKQAVVQKKVEFLQYGKGVKI